MFSHTVINYYAIITGLTWMEEAFRLVGYISRIQGLVYSNDTVFAVNSGFSYTIT